MGQFEAMGDYLSRLLVPDVFLALAVLGTLFYFLRGRLSNWFAISKVQAIWLGWSFAGILAFTLRPLEMNGTGEVFWLVDSVLWSRAFEIGSNWLLNVILFIPPAVFLTLFRKPPFWTWIGLAGSSALLETAQAITRWGVGDPADLVANAVGAMAGIALAVAWIKVSSWRRRR